MPSLQQITVASALLGLAAAAPMQEQKRSAGFRIDQVVNNDYDHNPKALYYTAVAKWAGRKGKSISQGSVTATPQSGDTEYLCPVTIGDQKFILDFDTGSSDTWVLGSQTASRGHTGYKPSSSSKASQGSTWQISYGDGSSASGNVYTDSIDIGGTTVNNQAIEVATKAAAAFTSGAEDGLLGLAFDTINTVQPRPVKTFMDNAIAAGLAPVFTADLKAGEPGSYDFGFVDKSKYSGQITYTDVDSSGGFWAFSPDDSDAGIADTGTTLLMLGDDTVDNYYQNVRSAQQINDGGESLYVFDCSEQLPDYTVTIGGTEFTVPGSDINMGDDGEGQCLGGIQSDASIGQAIYGDVFLKSVFAVFDLGTNGSPRLGFANKA